MKLYFLPVFILPLIFLIRRIIKGNLSKTEWVLYYIPIVAAIVISFYLAMNPKMENEDDFLSNFLNLAIIFLVSPILVGFIIPKYLSSKSVVHQFKNSVIEEGKIQKFSNRRKLDFEEYLNTAERKIIFVSITHELFTRDYIDLLGEYLFENIKIKIILLNPSSEYEKEKSTLFIVEKEELRRGIHDTLKKLCDFKNNLTENKENFSVLTHNYNIPESMIIIDGNDEYTNKKSSIKTEKYENSSDFTSRRSQVVFLKDNGFNYTEI